MLNDNNRLLDFSINGVLNKKHEKMLTALIVDDELPARQIIRAYIESFGNIKVIGECDNGFEALKELQQLKPDILFLDIQMPKVTGLELLEVLDNPGLIILKVAILVLLIRTVAVMTIEDTKKQKN